MHQYWWYYDSSDSITTESNDISILYSMMMCVCVLIVFTDFIDLSIEWAVWPWWWQYWWYSDIIQRADYSVTPMIIIIWLI